MDMQYSLKILQTIMHFDCLRSTVQPILYSTMTSRWLIYSFLISRFVIYIILLDGLTQCKNQAFHNPCQAILFIDVSLKRAIWKHTVEHQDDLMIILTA
jgi:hypothetical protein